MKLGLVQTKQNKLYHFTTPIVAEYGEIKILQDEMIEQNLRLIEEAGEKGCQFIVTTEAINYVGFEMQSQEERAPFIPTLEDKLFEKLSHLASKYKAYLVVGIYLKKDIEDKEKLFNTAVVYNPLGEIIEVYEKVHLAGTEKEYLVPGEEYKVIDTPFGNIGICICWDMQFPEVCRDLVLKGASFVVCPTWGWEGIYGHTRAYENGIYVAAAMGVPYDEAISGIRNPSEVIAPTGEILAQGDRSRAEVICCELNIEDCKVYRDLRMGDRRPKTYKSLIVTEKA